jgi:hypothetical protein
MGLLETIAPFQYKVKMPDTDLCCIKEYMKWVGGSGMTSRKLDSKERIIRTVKGEEVDCIPPIGGWINGVKNVAALAGLSIEEYLANPVGGVIKANQALGVDGMVMPVIPQSLNEIRSGNVAPDSEHVGVEPEALLKKAEQLPHSEKDVLSTFNAVEAEKQYRDYFEAAFKNWGGIEPIPNFWEMGGHFPLYQEYGYQAFLMACALYPDAVGKIWWARSLHSRERAKILAKLYKEYDLVPLMFCGEDVCNNNGPMVSPEFLRKYYFPTVKMITEPLVDMGVRFIHHCDGDVRPVVQDFIDIGFSGLQGFQYELGVDPYELKKLRSRKGEELLFFTGLSVTRTLPFGTVEDVREEVDYLLDFTDGGHNMFLFTSNVTGVEVPAENIQTAYHYVKTWDSSRQRHIMRNKWPWKVSHPEV